MSKFSSHIYDVNMLCEAMFFYVSSTAIAYLLMILKYSDNNLMQSQTRYNTYIYILCFRKNAVTMLILAVSNLFRQWLSGFPSF